MLPAREPHATAPALPPSAHAVIVEVPPRAQRERELQAAAQVCFQWVCWVLRCAMAVFVPSFRASNELLLAAWGGAECSLFPKFRCRWW